MPSSRKAAFAGGVHFFSNFHLKGWLGPQRDRDWSGVCCQPATMPAFIKVFGFARAISMAKDDGCCQITCRHTVPLDMRGLKRP